MYNLSDRKSGFTIVELLIVIVVIGILAAITIVAYNGVQEKAKVSQANADMSALVKAISVARINSDKTLKEITGASCTGCATTQAPYEAALDKIAAAAGANLNALKKGDPWGNRYSIDENEGENSVTPCTPDTLKVVNASLHPGLISQKIPLYGSYPGCVAP